jgi:glycosyltransferase involved in cell wall biosynthesis
MECSIIISTRNRAASLENTLQAFGAVRVPPGWRAELIVVDNASTDRTARVIQDSRLKNVAVRHLHENQPGKSHAQNAGVAAAQGEVLLFTDDDVVPADDWLEQIATPLLGRECEAVLGRIELAAPLQRAWMEPLHKTWLAATDGAGDTVSDLIGANMGIHRTVFQRIPKFDPELGPGALGFGEETLLFLQMREAGFRLRFVPQAVVIHGPDASRLMRNQWLDQARCRGRTSAYILHHWEHGEIRNPFFCLWRIRTKLFLRQLMDPPPALEEEGCPAWEMSYVSELEMCRQFLRERKRPRNYLPHGLVRKQDQA